MSPQACRLCRHSPDPLTAALLSFACPCHAKCVEFIINKQRSCAAQTKGAVFSRGMNTGEISGSGYCILKLCIKKVKRMKKEYFLTKIVLYSSSSYHHTTANVP